MTESTFQKLTKLGYQFWSRKGFNNNSTETTPLTYILKDKLLIIGNKNEFDTPCLLNDSMKFKPQSRAVSIQAFTMASH